MAIRKGISKRIRFEVFKRDSFKCQYCGKSAPEVVLHIDHIKPVKGGGENDLFNLLTACQECNLGKGARVIDDSSEVSKQKKVLDDINEKRNQLEMLFQWRKELLGLDKTRAKLISQEINKHISRNGYSVKESFVDNLIHKFDDDIILRSIEESANAYLCVEDESKEDQRERVEKYISKIVAMATINKASKGNPFLKDAYYLRGVARNCLNLSNYYTHSILELFVYALSAGVGTREIKTAITSSSSYPKLERAIDFLITRAEQEG